MKRYLITDRPVRQDAEMIQVRNKELPVRDLVGLTRDILQANPASKVLVNTRLDVALVCGAHGLHLPAGSPAPSDFRRIAPAGFLIGVSCHSVDELLRAEGEGADFAVYGPVFHPLSKSSDARPPVGLEGLRAACAAVRLPIYALGGVTWSNAASCLEAGAVGVAGITLFRSDLLDRPEPAGGVPGT